MTRFGMEYSGRLGEFWRRNAEQEIARMQQRIDNDEIRTNINGGAFWNINGRFLPEEQAIILIHTDFPFSLEATNRAREEQNKAFLATYRSSAPSAEQKAEMQAAFGKGTTVVDVISGERIRL